MNPERLGGVTSKEIAEFRRRWNRTPTPEDHAEFQRILPRNVRSDLPALPAYRFRRTALTPSLIEETIRAVSGRVKHPTHYDFGKRAVLEVIYTELNIPPNERKALKSVLGRNFYFPSNDYRAAFVRYKNRFGLSHVRTRIARIAEVAGALLHALNEHYLSLQRQSQSFPHDTGDMFHQPLVQIITAKTLFEQIYPVQKKRRPMRQPKTLIPLPKQGEYLRPPTPEEADELQLFNKPLPDARFFRISVDRPYTFQRTALTPSRMMGIIKRLQHRELKDDRHYNLGRRILHRVLFHEFNVPEDERPFLQDIFFEQHAARPKGHEEIQAAFSRYAQRYGEDHVRERLQSLADAAQTLTAAFQTYKNLPPHQGRKLKYGDMFNNPAIQVASALDQFMLILRVKSRTQTA